MYFVVHVLDEDSQMNAIAFQFQTTLLCVPNTMSAGRMIELFVHIAVASFHIDNRHILKCHEKNPE